MPNGRRLEALVREFDRELQRLERGALVRLDGALRLAAQRLERELRGLYLVALDDAAMTPSLLMREARARALLEQVRAGLDLTTGANANSVFGQLIGDSFDLGARNALEALSLFEQGLVTLASGARLTVAARATQASARLAHHGTDFALKVEELVIDGIVRGRGWSRTAGAVRREVGVTRWKAEQLVRTESVNASHASRSDTYRSNGVSQVVWLATADEVVCGYCAHRSGNHYKVDDVIIPAHPNCVVGDTVVSAADVSAYSRRWYEGPVVTITSRSGHRLTVTPNHPVLTPSGWVPAGRLNVGSNVLSQGGSGRVRFIGEPHHEQVHGVVEELADSFFKAPQVATAPVPVTDEHFHGDGRGSKVAVIGADSHLRPDLHAAFQQQLSKLAFLGTVVQSLALDRLSGLHERFPARLTPASGLMGGLDLARALLIGHASPLDHLGFASGADHDAALAEPLIHCEGCGSELVSKDAGSFARFVPSDQFTPREVRSLGGLNASSGEHLRDSGRASPVGAGEGSDAFPFAVAPEDVVAVEWGGFAGHVYNLETAAGMYVANGIMTHNCRCFAAPYRPHWKELGLVDEEWNREHHRETMNRAKGKSTGSQPSPFEKAAGMTRAPTPL